jgi:hypothetical protein
MAPRMAEKPTALRPRVGGTRLRARPFAAKELPRRVDPRLAEPRKGLGTTASSFAAKGLAPRVASSRVA